MCDHKTNQCKGLDKEEEVTNTGKKSDKFNKPMLRTIIIILVSVILFVIMLIIIIQSKSKKQDKSFESLDDRIKEKE